MNTMEAILANPFKPFTHCGATIKFMLDDPGYAENPIQEWDHDVRVVMWHRGYDFGNCNDFATPHDFEDYCKSHPVVRLPIYMIDHSGLSVNTTGFGCPWDSGQIGWIFITCREARQIYQWEKISAKRRRFLEEIMRSTVKLLDDYLQGNVYGYQIERDGEIVDSCWGFYGEVDPEVVKEAMEEAELSDPQTHFAFSCA